MARAALDWSTLDLAAKAGIGGNTVNRFEAGHDLRMSSVAKMQAAFEAAGIEFTNGDAPGVRMRRELAK
jgi:transcriptional regulator with XRE-family HTH domain